MHNFFVDLGTFSSAVWAHLFTLLAGCAATVIIGVIGKYFYKKLTWKHDLVVFILFLFFACFQAWQDEHRNTTAVINDKSTLLGLKNTCDSDLRVEIERSKQLQLQLDSHTGIISNLQNSVNQNQSSVSACVLSVAKSVVPVKQVTTLRFSRVNMNSTTDLGTYVALTNISVSPVNATFSCPMDFKLITADETAGSKVAVIKTMGDVTSRKAEFSFQAPAWDKSDPIVITALFAKDYDPWECKLDIR
jgi:hypothetical protein